MTNDDKEEIKGLKLFGLLFPLGQVQTPTFRSRRTPAQSCKLSNKGAEEVAPSIEVMHSLITNEAYFNSPTPVVGLKYNSTHLCTFIFYYCIILLLLLLLLLLLYCIYK